MRFLSFLLLFRDKRDQDQPRDWCLPVRHVGGLSAGEGGWYCLQDMQMICLLHPLDYTVWIEHPSSLGLIGEIRNRDYMPNKAPQVPESKSGQV